jgi:1-phosphatidylinositol phosphodiesterase
MQVALICIVAGMLMAALPCEAASVATKLAVYNNTQIAFTTTATVTDNFDWEHHRPDHNFNPREIEALSGSTQPEDLNSNARNAPFNMIITFDNGDVVNFRTDQKDTTRLNEYEAKKLTLGGPQAAQYIASWVILPKRTLAISITARQDPSAWMASVPDNWLISQMTIPGTHDSASLYNGASLGFAKTQDLNLEEQLNLGVRYFDIRLNKDLDVYHGPIYQHLKFADVINICAKFLETNPSETILMSINASDIKQNNLNPDLFARAVYAAIDSGSARWSLGEHIPTLGSVRSEVVLLRRYPVKSAPEVGIDLSDWPDNTRYAIRTNSADVTYAIQDHWQCCATSGGKADKRSEISEQLDRAQSSSDSAPDTLYFNFMSANRFPIVNPRNNAEYFNPYLLGLLVQSPARIRNGVLAMDFIEWERTNKALALNDPQALIQQIISYNPE